MLGYIGGGDLFHETDACPSLTGDVRVAPETKAVKWGCDYCPVCFPDT